MAILDGTVGPDIILGTAEADTINGFDGDDSLSGEAGNDIIFGGLGVDTMFGGAGDDIFYVDRAPDVLDGRIIGDRIDGGEGYDIVIFSVDSGAAGGGTRIEELRAAPGTAPLNLTEAPGRRVVGNDGNNVISIYGAPTNPAATLVGGRGDDQYFFRNSSTVIIENVGEGNDVAFVSNVFDNLKSFTLPAGVEIETLSTVSNSFSSTFSLTGNEFAQTIVGDFGSNQLAGGGGADTLAGLRGDDTYLVSDVRTVIAEAEGEGNDTVLTSVGLVLTANASVEIMRVTDSATTSAIDLTGSTVSQTITGNAGDNVINGFGGSDTMVGLGGNDQYLVRSLGDVVIEANGGGTDTVFTTVSYNLGVNEIEVLSTVTNTDTTPIDLIGNFATQYVVGNYGANVLNGGSGGLDTLIGLRGDDVYAVGDSRTVVVEQAGEGTDTVVVAVDYSLATGVSVEVLAAQNRAGTAPLTLRGNEQAQTVAGNAGANTIDGGLGNDVLIGGAGADLFMFSSALGTSNVDAIADFASGDRIGLSSAIFAGVGSAVTASNFITGAAATTADQRIVFNQATGQLFYDADGNGSSVAALFALLLPGTSLDAGAFTVVPAVALI